MRIAIARPNLAPDRLEHRALDAVIAALAQRHDVELFGEAAGLDLPVEGTRAHHYLRFADRQAAVEFDAALYPLGRDAYPYEPSLLLARRLPGVVWLLDTIPHHLMIGGVALAGRWDEYLEAMSDAFGSQGRAAAINVAWNWASRALLRRYDLAAVRISGQRAVLAATPNIAAGMRRHLGEVPVVPVPLAPDDVAAPRAARPERLLLPAPNVGRPQPGLRGLARWLSAASAAEVVYAVPRLFFEATIGPFATQLGIRDRIRWLVSPAAATLEREVEQATLVAVETTDPNVAERLLVEQALARGLPTLVPRVPSWSHLSAPEVFGIEPGRCFGGALASALTRLHEDPELHAGLGTAARAWALQRPDAKATALALEQPLREAGAGALVPSGSAAVWARLSRRMERRCVPASASEPVRGHVRRLLRRNGGVMGTAIETGGD